MKKYLAAVLAGALLVAGQSVFAQQAAPAPAANNTAAAGTAAPAANAQAAAPANGGAPTPNATSEVGTSPQNNSDTPQQALKEISVEKFETDGLWSTSISSDAGVSVCRLFKGGPADDKPLADDPNASNQYVLGVRTDFFRRGYTDIILTPARPFKVDGIVKSVSIWVAGRNYNHTLYLIVRDRQNKVFELMFGNQTPNLNFQGRKKLTVSIPPQPADATNGIVQQNYHYASDTGLYIIGLRIACDQLDAYGTYYVYFDDMRATTDLFAEQSRDPDDPSDDW
jgi:hypothetical protein